MSMNPLDPLGIIGKTKKQIDNFAARSGLPSLPDLPGLSNSGFTEGQTIVIKSKAIYGWKARVTVERDDPDHDQVWVKEITPAVQYEDIEEGD